jgi:hypothetical protein
MAGRVWPLGLVLALAAGGCLPAGSESLLVSANPFDDGQRPRPATPTPVQTAHAPASDEAAGRVLAVAEKVRTANPQLGLRPGYVTIGAPWEELFHVGDNAVFITEGLVRQCRTDEQLAALLCHELGKMAAEHDALANAAGPAPDRGPPIDAPVGKDAGGAFGAPDGVRAVELARYERRKRGGAAAPDADALARSLLEKAGGRAADLEAVAPLLRAADEHMTFEKQITAARPAAPH